MKEVKLLDCIRAVSFLSIIHVLTRIQEYSLKSELPCNKGCSISLLFFYINRFIKSVIGKPLSYNIYSFCELLRSF